MSDGIHVVVDTKVAEQILRNLPRNIDRFMDGEAENVVTDTKLSFNTSPPGRSYGSHTASMAGYPPNIDTGELTNSISWERSGQYERNVNVAAPQGLWMEFGTVHVAPRPFLSPAFERERMAFEDNARDAGLLQP